MLRIRIHLGRPSGRRGERRTRWRAAACGGAAAAVVLTTGLATGPVPAYAHTRSRSAAAVGQAPLTAETWGDNTAGELGDDSLAQSDVPVAVHGLSGVVSVAAGGRHDLALLANGTVVAWGDDTFGELGNGSASSNGDSEHPIPVKGLSGVTAVAAGEAHSLALLANGTVMAWGDNRSGQLGTGATRSSAVPVPVPGLSGVTAIAAGSEFSLALLANGTVMAWGTNGNGQLGDGQNGIQQASSDVPVRVKGVADATAITAGGQVSAALLKNGTVAAWPSFHGPSAAKVPLLTNVKATVAGFDSFVTLRGNGTVVTWQPTSTGFTTPVKVPGLSQVTAVATNTGGCCTSVIQFSLALTASGTVMAWGDDHFGELGDGSTTGSSTPVAVTGLTGVSAIVAGGLQGIALTAGTSPAPSPRSGPFSSIWRQTANPRNINEPGGLKVTFLESVSAASSTDAWAVGFHSLASTQPLAEHFNGRTWQISHIPLPQGASGGSLSGVDELAPANVWAVGSSIWNFNGHAWTPVSAPGSDFAAIAGTSADDLWAVGAPGFNLEFDQFNGQTWQSVTAPGTGTPGIGAVPTLNGVSADSPSDAWAVGSTTLSTKNPDLSQDTLTLHWNGDSWQAVPSPCLTGQGTIDNKGNCNTTKASDQEQNHLTGVTALSSDNVWASGYENGSNGTVPYVLHWNGTTWSLIKTPSLGGTELFGITALSADDMWVSGFDFSLTGLGFAVTEHFNGTRWSIAPVLEPGQSAGVPEDELTAITSVAPRTLFAIGSQSVPDQGFCCEFGLAERSTKG
jgi:alpha-tubulin suppressor-like RCC1 family protein